MLELQKKYQWHSILIEIMIYNSEIITNTTNTQVIYTDGYYWEPLPSINDYIAQQSLQTEILPLKLYFDPNHQNETRIWSFVGGCLEKATPWSQYVIVIFFISETKIVICILTMIRNRFWRSRIMVNKCECSLASSGFETWLYISKNIIF